ncbi:MAG: ABC transporter permease [Chloroflexi bacterium]|nr:ABC transporter permease [Chloroflexota bacterium]
MFLHILAKSLRHRWSRILVAVLAVTMGASLAAAALSVSVGMEEKVGRTLRAYGANLVLVPKSAALGVSDATLVESDLTVHVNHLGSSVLGHAPFLYAVVESEGQPVALAGTWFDAATRINPWWKIEGNAPANDDRASALVGANVADKWRVKIGDDLAVRYRDSQTNFRVTGILNTGGAEDDQIFVSLAAAQALTNRAGQVSLAQISALTTQTPLEETARAVEQMLPAAQAKTVQQIAQGEVALIRRVQALLALIAAIVLVAAAVSVGATMTTVMLERKREIGLMKAIGAEARRIGALFLAEAGALGIVGGLAGYALGFAFAQIIAQSVFATAVELNGWVAVAALVIAVTVAVIGSVLPVRRALAVEAAVVLRGE